MAMNSVEVMQTKFPGKTWSFNYWIIIEFGNSFLTWTVGRHIEEYRAELGKFGVIGDMALQPIISLSGGQKSRVAFALLSMLK